MLDGCDEFLELASVGLSGEDPNGPCSAKKQKDYAGFDLSPTALARSCAVVIGESVGFSGVHQARRPPFPNSIIEIVRRTYPVRGFGISRSSICHKISTIHNSGGKFDRN